ncbi:hypothetical protein [Roseofilum sp. Guam]|uniref:hypothetical protein n=1 Tax=Roseofilum sp. Guam TaxID=2821502 RepID=UPI001B193AC7|nr:hypothetical protein [Roseofilum sp. Guam]MBP0031495.1 hypothetical protein [Roseofilum sp. Guam]
MHYIDEYYVPLSPKLMQVLCDFANGLGTKEIVEKYGLTKAAALARQQFACQNLNVYSEDLPDEGRTYSRRVVTVTALKAARIGLIIFDYDTCKYVPNPDFKQPDKVFLPRDTSNLKRKNWDEHIFSDEQISRAKELLISGEMCRSQIIRQVLKTDSGKIYQVGRKKLLEIEAGLEAQGYKCPKMSQAKKKQLQELHSSRSNPWRQEARAGYLAWKERQESQS